MLAAQVDQYDSAMDEVSAAGPEVELQRAADVLAHPEIRRFVLGL